MTDTQREADSVTEASVKDSTSSREGRRPVLVVILCIFLALRAGHSLFQIWPLVFVFFDFPESRGQILFVALFVRVVLEAAVAIGLWRGKEWARFLFVMALPIPLAFIWALGGTGLLQMILWGVCVYFLFRPNVSAYFKASN